MVGEENQSSVGLEERKFALDAEIRRAELALRRAETRRNGLNPAQATIAVAVRLTRHFLAARQSRFCRKK